MGVARLLAKGWIVFCLFAGGHAVVQVLAQGGGLVPALQSVAICVLLFGAMGLLFIAGFGASATGNTPLLTRLRPRNLIPSFADLGFLAFVALSFAAQVYFISEIGGSAAGHGLHEAMRFAVPGLPALPGRLASFQVSAPQQYSGTLA